VRRQENGISQALCFTPSATPKTTPHSTPQRAERSDFQYAYPTAKAMVVMGASKQAMGAWKK